MQDGDINGKTVKQEEDGDELLDVSDYMGDENRDSIRVKQVYNSSVLSE